MSSARFARMFFGCNERVLASNRSGGTGEKPMAVSSSKTAPEHISMGAGRATVQRTYFRASSKSQSCCGTGIVPAGTDFTDSARAEFVELAGKMPAGPTNKMSVLRRSSLTNKNKMEHMNRPATKMPMAMSTPSSEKLMAPLSTRARKPTAVVSAPKNTARPSFATDVAIACRCGSPSARAW